jgi:hypothetical protein
MNKDIQDGKIITESCHRSPISSIQSEDTRKGMKSATFASAPVSASASMKKNTWPVVTRGKAHNTNDSEKV